MFGKIKMTISKRSRAVVYTQEVPYSQLSDSDKLAFDQALLVPDPYAVLRAKTQHLAHILGCTEGEAEALILDRVGAPDSGFSTL